MIGSSLFARLQAMSIPVWGSTHQPAAAIAKNNIFYLNLLDPPSAWQFPTISFDVVYLCAGVCRLALCEENSAAARKVNIDGMIALARYFANAGAFIVYLSTNQVFSGNEPCVLPSATYQPQNEYGRQKMQAEELLKAHCQHLAIIRLTKVIAQSTSLIANWISCLRQHQLIHAFHDMVLAPVSLNQVLDVMISIGHGKQAGCYHVSGAQDVSYYDIAVYLAKCLQQSELLVQATSAIEHGMQKSFLPRFTTLDCSSTIAICGSKPPQFTEVMQECFGIV